MVELVATTAGNEVVLKDARGRVQRLSLKELLFSDRARVVPDRPGPSGGDPDEVASVVLDQLTDEERELTAERAGHIREVLTGYRSGSRELAADGEPREKYAPHAPMEDRRQPRRRTSESLSALWSGGSAPSVSEVRPGQLPGTDAGLVLRRPRTGGGWRRRLR